jgi:hypothetical protein
VSPVSTSVPARALGLPHLTEADPPVAGEGSLDPLALGSIAERLGDHLLPHITNRMRRPRMLTAMTVGALATEGLEDTSPPSDGRSTPSICFEWLLIESFVRRRNLLGADELKGVPGTSKVTAVVERGERVTSGNYLKTASVFGFTGVLMPLARAGSLMTSGRTPADRATELAQLWEAGHELDGFADNAPRTIGGRLRRDIREVVDRSLRSGRCSAPPASHLLDQLATALGPATASAAERRWLLRTVIDSGHDLTGEIAQAMRPFRRLDTDQDLIEAMRPRASADLRLRLDAIVAYEAVATRLEAVLSEWRFRSTLAGVTPVTAGQIGATESVAAAASTLSDASSKARDVIGDLDPSLVASLDDLVQPFEGTGDPAELAAAVIEHHHAVQQAKPPHGKRPWFEPSGSGATSGFVVRPLYRLGDAPSVDFDHIERRYRLAAFNGLLGDLR